MQDAQRTGHGVHQAEKNPASFGIKYGGFFLTRDPEACNRFFFALWSPTNFPSTTPPASRADGASTGACGRFGLEAPTCMGLVPARKLRSNR